MTSDELKQSTIAALRLIQSNLNAAIDSLVVGVEKGELSPDEVQQLERTMSVVASAPMLALGKDTIGRTQ